jgi:hypothetical protein
MEIPFDYNKIMSDRKLFNEVVYTPLSEAVRILEERQKDKDLVKKVEELLGGDIPSCFSSDKFNAVHFRQIATPNFDALWFLDLAQLYNFNPIFFEYHNDKFTSNNEFKHSLGQLRIHNGFNKNGGYNKELATIIDFNKYNGKKLNEVLTLWDESLIDFHRKIFDLYNLPKQDISFYDASSWFSVHGHDAKQYYKEFFLLFVKDGILFENFLTAGSEGEFSKSIVLPAIEYVYGKTGLKPIIVPIPPMDLEDDEHSICYKPLVKEIIQK